ncbi:MAG: TlpA disulfide reductase family protein [Spirochaetota bacterium]|jgi:thiol-disulfide isomerase/thioredoxin|nr:TlpA disulfide reductase family protein [Spirochaetota bacterium]
MNRKIGIFGIFMLALLFMGILPITAQENVELPPIKQQLYNLGFGVFPEPVEAPDFTVPLLNGPEASLSDYRGKVVVLNLWATWCPPCRAEMPSMQKLYEMLKPQGLEILAVAAPNPPRETLDKIADFVQAGGFSFPVLIDHEFDVNGIYSTGSIPTSYVIDSEGELVARLTGAIDWMDEGIVSVFREMLPQ